MSCSKPEPLERDLTLGNGCLHVLNAKQEAKFGKIGSPCSAMAIAYIEAENKQITHSLRVASGPCSFFRWASKRCPPHTGPGGTLNVWQQNEWHIAPSPPRSSTPQVRSRASRSSMDGFIRCPCSVASLQLEPRIVGDLAAFSWTTALQVRGWMFEGVQW